MKEAYSAAKFDLFWYWVTFQEWIGNELRIIGILLTNIATINYIFNEVIDDGGA